ncbi:TPA: hypothetical protein ACH3X2_005664 [Trebouxia sp. C0005]
MSYHHQAQIVCSRTITSRRIIAQLQSQREQRPQGAEDGERNSSPSVRGTASSSDSQPPRRGRGRGRGRGRQSPSPGRQHGRGRGRPREYMPDAKWTITGNGRGMNVDQSRAMFRMVRHPEDSIIEDIFDLLVYQPGIHYSQHLILFNPYDMDFEEAREWAETLHNSHEVFRGRQNDHGGLAAQLQRGSQAQQRREQSQPARAQELSRIATDAQLRAKEAQLNAAQARVEIEAAKTEAALQASVFQQQRRQQGQYSSDDTSGDAAARRHAQDRAASFDCEFQAAARVPGQGGSGSGAAADPFLRVDAQPSYSSHGERAILIIASGASDATPTTDIDDDVPSSD